MTFSCVFRFCHIHVFLLINDFLGILFLKAKKKTKTNRAVLQWVGVEYQQQPENDIYPCVVRDGSFRLKLNFLVGRKDL